MRRHKIGIVDRALRIDVVATRRLEADHDIAETMQAKPEAATDDMGVVLGGAPAVFDRASDRFGPPCVVDPPFVLRRQSLTGGPGRAIRDDLPSSSVFVMPSGAVCYADAEGVQRIGPRGGPAEPVTNRVGMHEEHPRRRLERIALLQVGRDGVEQRDPAAPERLKRMLDQLSAGTLVAVKRPLRQQVAGEHRPRCVRPGWRRP